MKLNPFADNSQIRFRGISTSFVALPNANSEHIFIVPFDALINGIEVLVHAKQGDHLSACVLDGVNFFGLGEDTNLDQFLTEWKMRDDRHAAAEMMLNYAARVKQGFKFKFVYCNTSENEKNIDLNLFLHKTNRQFVIEDFK